jgi:glycosyltransferase involved in cell wall biosynthesis
MTESLEGKKLTFYGHFTGYSSYPVVCNALAKWLLLRGIDLRIANLRGDALRGQFEQIQIPISPTLGMGPPSGDRRKGKALLFGFPSWLREVPTHDHMIGYHVGDVTPLPIEWFAYIQENADTVLTPSKWCSDLIGDLGVQRPINVVHHGIDSSAFRPTIINHERLPVTLRHYCSSPLLERKGTLEVLRASRRLLDDGCDGVPFSIVVSVHPFAIEYVKAYNDDRGQQKLVITVDKPKEANSMAFELGTATAVVQPSRAEGFGCIPIEAAACGTPIITTNVTGHSDWFEHVSHHGSVLQVKTEEFDPKSAYLNDDESCSGGRAPVIDEESLFQQMRDAIINNVKYRKKALDGASEIRSHWDWATVLDRELHPVLSSILA